MDLIIFIPDIAVSSVRILSPAIPGRYLLNHKKTSAMKTLFLLVALCASTGLFAQQFEVPKDYVLKSNDDFAKYEKDVIACIDWLMATPYNQGEEKRTEANRFLLEWIVGAPNVTIQINGDIVTFMDNSPELAAIFMGGWTKYVLETKDDNMYKGNLNGIESVVKYYKANKKFIGEDKAVEKYVQMKEKGTLGDYIKKKM
jgi:hypothetical protein